MTALDDLYWRAEILQALYWMHSEGLASDASPEELARFLAADAATVRLHLDRLVFEGYLAGSPSSPASPTPPAWPAASRASSCSSSWSAPSPGSSSSSSPSSSSSRRYALTPVGLAEGARSFADEFAELTHPGHYECATGCWCHDPRHAGDPCPSQPRPKEPEEAPRGR